MAKGRESRNSSLDIFIPLYLTQMSTAMCSSMCPSLDMRHAAASFSLSARSALDHVVQPSISRTVGTRRPELSDHRLTT